MCGVTAPKRNPKPNSKKMNCGIANIRNRSTLRLSCVSVFTNSCAALPNTNKPKIIEISKMSHDTNSNTLLVIAVSGMIRVLNVMLTVMSAAQNYVCCFVNSKATSTAFSNRLWSSLGIGSSAERVHRTEALGNCCNDINK